LKITFFLKPKPFVAPETRSQFEARQPSLLTILLLFFVPMWSPTLIASGLMHSDAFAQLTERHWVAYRMAFFGSQMTLIMLAIAFLRVRHAAALWIPSGRFWRVPFASVAILLPLLAWHIFKCVSGMNAIEAAIREIPREQLSEFFSQSFEKVWARLSYDASVDGVVFTSFGSFIAPVLEEMINALAANALLKRARPVLAILGVGTAFAAAHMVQFGLGEHLLPLIWAGATYAALRINSGNLLVPIFNHILINVFVFTPKWFIAWIHFALL
jgi:membrane protease YdiL (CAAX protease family)